MSTRSHTLIPLSVKAVTEQQLAAEFGVEGTRDHPILVRTALGDKQVCGVDFNYDDVLGWHYVLHIAPLQV